MPPKIHITHSARSALRAALKDSSEGDVVHLDVSARFEHDLQLGRASDEHETLDIGGIAIVVTTASPGHAEGITIDYVESDLGSGFRIDNPNAPAAIVEVGAQRLKELLDSGAIEILVDVRTTWEREIAKLDKSLLFDDESSPGLLGLPRDTPIAFYCHHGIRSRAAGSQFLQRGFTKVYNLAGGIDAWSQVLDPSVPRY